MLANLRNIYLQRGDIARQRLAEDRIRAIEAVLRASAGSSLLSSSRSSLVH